MTTMTTPPRTGECTVCGAKTADRTLTRYAVTYAWYSGAGERITDTAYVDAKSADEARQLVYGPRSDPSRAGGLAVGIESVRVASRSHWRCDDFDACADRRNARRRRPR